MVQSVAESGRGYQPGQQCDLPNAKALEWERFGWCRIVKPTNKEPAKRGEPK